MAIVVVARVRAKPGMEAELRSTLAAAAARARGEPGNLQFELYGNLSDPAEISSFERWRSQADLDGHLKQPYMQVFQARSKYLIDGEPELTTCCDAPRTIAPQPEELTSMNVQVQQTTLRQFLTGVLAAAQAVQHAASGMKSDTHEIPISAHGDKKGREEVFVTYTVGKGEFAKWYDPHRKAKVLLSALTCDMFRLDGTPDGKFRGRWYPQVTPQQMLRTPAQTHSRPFNKPVGPFVETGVGAWTEAEWKFRDGSSIIGTGPASLQLVQFDEGDSLFLVSVAGIVSNGTGKYANARGVKTALGATYIEAGKDLFNLPAGEKFDAVTVETFRVVQEDNLADSSGNKGSQGSEEEQAADNDVGDDK